MAQFIKLLKRWLCDARSSIVEKNWVFSLDRCQLQLLQFLVHLTELLSILLRCNGFSRVQKAVVDQSGSRPPVTMTFFSCKFGLRKCLDLLLSSATELIIAGCHIKSSFHCASQSN